jgi:alpha-tubulin suppressor-like RCC1 family protein
MLPRAALLALLVLALFATSAAAYKALSVGGSQACALRADDTAVCWGARYDGATGAPADRFAELASGGFNHCGLRLADRSIACWGLYAPFWMPQLPRAPIAGIGIGTFHLCVVVASDGHVACVGGHTGPPGYEDPGEADPPPGAFKTVTAGWSHTCAIRFDDTVACWGEESWTGKTQPPAGAFAQIAAGQEHTCGLRVGGAVVCWGFDREGQIEAPPGTFTQVSAGTNHSCAVRDDAEVVCWGDDRYGESDPPPGPFRAVGAGHLFTCGLRPDGSIACWGANDLGQANPPPPETRPDTTPPLLACTADRATLWPPNHRLVPVMVTVTVSDAESGPAGFELRAVTSSQPDRPGPHAGDVAGWTLGAADASGLLRAERDGGGARRYALAYRGFDGAGNVADCTTTVTVPASAARR